MVFSWFKSEQRERWRKVKLDRKHLEARSRRFLKNYLNADETRKPQYYRAVEEASKQCQPAGSGLPPPELEDAQIAEATSSAAMKMVLAREERSALKKDDRISDFVTDAYATVGIAYHRAAGVYTTDKDTEFRDSLNGQSIARSVTRSCRELVVRLAQVDDGNRYQHQHRKGG